MRKSNQEIFDPAIIEDILQQGNICRVAFYDHDIPYLLPFNYGYHQGKMFIHAAPEGKKIDLIKQNYRVAFEITPNYQIIKNKDACKWSTYYRSVIGKGMVEILDNKDEKVFGLNIIMQQHGWEGGATYNEASLKSMMILCIHIIEITGKQSSNWEKVMG